MASVDGLVSGLNTSSIISQLMQLERQGQVRLQTRQRETEGAIAALQALNTKFLGVTNATKSLTTGTGWDLAAATSSDTTRATAQATAGAASGDLTFLVKQLAGSEILKSSGTVADTNVTQVATGPVTITKDGVSKSVDVGDGTLGAIVKAINGAGAGVTATAVQVSTGAYSLQLTSTTTGNTAITVDDGAGGNPFASSTLGTVGVLTEGRDALLQVGVAADGSGGYQVSRKTNTISDLLAGTTITLLKQDTAIPVTVKTTSDAAGIADGVAKLVDAINATLSEMTRTGSYDLNTKRGGPLHGDSGIRSLRSQLATAVTGSSSSSAGLSGVSVQRDGTVLFDRQKFLDALAKDPAAVKTALGPSGLAGRVAAVAERASRSATAAGGAGVITSSITSRESNVAALKQNIASWDQRLALREQRLVAQFASLEKALGASRSQGQWLAGQIAGLPSYGG